LSEDESLLGPLRAIAIVVFAVVTVLAVAATKATAQHSASRDQCIDQGLSSAQRISACSAVMQQDFSQKVLAYAFNNRAIAFQAEREYQHAIADYTDAIRLDPEFAHAFYNRGTAYHAQGDYDHAIADYSDAIRLDSTYSHAYKNRGLAYQSKGDLDQANADLNEAYRLMPTKPR
jgi:tetratricopeptide (TPR) repeat protein